MMASKLDKLFKLPREREPAGEGVAWWLETTGAHHAWAGCLTQAGWSSTGLGHPEDAVLRL